MFFAAGRPIKEVVLAAGKDPSPNDVATKLGRSTMTIEMDSYYGRQSHLLVRTSNWNQSDVEKERKEEKS